MEEEKHRRVHLYSITLKYCLFSYTTKLKLNETNFLLRFFTKMISRASTRTVHTPIYRVPPHKYWAQYWNPWPPGVIATLQLIMIFGTLSMETGNALVDLFRSNVYSGYWSFPFTMSAVIATYACGKRKRKFDCLKIQSMI